MLIPVVVYWANDQVVTTYVALRLVQSLVDLVSPQAHYSLTIDVMLVLLLLLLLTQIIVYYHHRYVIKVIDQMKIS